MENTKCIKCSSDGPMASSLFCRACWEPARESQGLAQYIAQVLSARIAKLEADQAGGSSPSTKAEPDWCELRIGWPIVR